MDDLVARFVDLSQQVDAGRPGRDFSVVEDELMGYEDTPLETALYDSVHAIENHLEQHPESLTSERLAALLRGVLSCRSGVDGYRARLMRYAGDYGDESSPIAYYLTLVLRAVARTLRQLESGAQAIVDGVPRELWESKVTLYYTVGPCEKVDLEETIETHLHYPLL